MRIRDGKKSIVLKLKLNDIKVRFSCGIYVTFANVLDVMESNKLDIFNSICYTDVVK